MVCPRDTDGDGNCGIKHCRWCGPDRPLNFVGTVDLLRELATRGHMVVKDIGPQKVTADFEAVAVHHEDVEALRWEFEDESG